jgi:hypothetical protein
MSSTLLAVGAAGFGGTIDFENVPNAFLESNIGGGGQDLGGYYAGVTFGPNEQVTTTSTVFPAHSGTNELTTSDFGTPNILMTFDSPQTDVSFWYTTSFGIVATAFDSGNHSLASFTAPSNVNLATSEGVSSFGDLFTGVADNYLARVR